MAIFFDTGEPNHIGLLHPAIQTSSDLQWVVDKLEEEILIAYSQLVSKSENRVMLIGYDNDAPASSEQPITDAIRRTIADGASGVLRHADFHHHLLGFKSERLDYYDYDTGREGQSKPLSALSSLLPVSWLWRLEQFDKRIYGAIV